MTQTHIKERKWGAVKGVFSFQHRTSDSCADLRHQPHMHMGPQREKGRQFFYMSQDENITPQHSEGPLLFLSQKGSESSMPQKAIVRVLPPTRLFIHPSSNAVLGWARGSLATNY